MSARYRLGKVFVSHSSSDKAFVRKLAKELEGLGFQTWLDEKELLAGDPLPRKISEGVQSAPAVLVVASAAATKSSWLKFELNHATQRMIEGRCRVIPVVIDDAELPPEVTGLLYSDFRVGWSSGFKSIVTALDHEAQVKARTGSFWSRAEELLSQSFDSVGSVFSDPEGYESEDFNAIFLPRNGEPSEDVTVLYETVPDYRRDRKPVPQKWAAGLSEKMERLGQDFGLVLSERPLGFEMPRPFEQNERLGAIPNGWGSKVYGYTVYADLSSLADFSAELEVVRASRIFLEQLTRELGK